MGRIRERLLTRRKLLGAGVVLGLGALELESLTGRWDHRRLLSLAHEELFAASLRKLMDPVQVSRGAVLHVGHSTHVVIVNGVRFLTDPWFHDPAFGSMAHEHPLPARPEDIAPLDAILVSHDHPDHVDIDALRALPDGATCIVATTELAQKAKSAGRKETHVLRPWETIMVRDVKITAVPALHDIYEIGFVMEGGGTSVYFAGDTRLHPALPEIRERFAPQASILPVDGTRIRGGDLHVMRPEHAVEAARTLGSRVVMPSHAEGVLYDPLARYVISDNIDGAGAIFRDMMKAALPAIRCELPAPGELVVI